MGDLVKRELPGPLKDFIAERIETTPYLETQAPEGLNDGDWAIVAAGVITGKSRYRILQEMKVAWAAAGHELKFDGEFEALQYIGRALKAFAPQREQLASLYREARVVDLAYFADRSVRIRAVDRTIRIIEAAIIEKQSMGLPVNEYHLELQHFERLMTMLNGLMTQEEQTAGEAVPDALDDRKQPPDGLTLNQYQMWMIEGAKDRVAEEPVDGTLKATCSECDKEFRFSLAEPPDKRFCSHCGA